MHRLLVLLALTLNSAAVIQTSNEVSETYKAAKEAFDNFNPAALKLLQRVVEIDPKHPQAWDDLGQQYLRVGMVSMAEESFKKQIEIDAFHPSAYRDLARIYFARDPEKAAQLLRKQLEVNPLSAQAHIELGDLLLNEKKSTEALKEIDAATRIEPEWFAYWSDLGRAHAQLQHESEALEAFGKAAELSPSPAASRIVAAMYLARNNLAIDRAREWAESGCQDVSAQTRLLSVREKSHREDWAPEYMLPYCWAAMFELNRIKGDSLVAEKFLRAAWRLSQYREIGERLGEFLEDSGRKTDALQIYAQAASTNSGGGLGRKKLEKALVSKTAVEKAIGLGRTEMENTRTVVFAKNMGIEGSGLVVLMERPDGTAAEFDLRNDKGKLRENLPKLQAVFKDRGFPDLWPALYPRAGVIHCSKLNRECMIVFMTFNQSGLN